MNPRIRLEKPIRANQYTHACTIHVDNPEHEYEYVPDFLEC